MDYSVFPNYGGRGEPRKRTKNRVKRQKASRDAEVRAYVFMREREICRCCRNRPAESRHEIKSRGAGGKISKTNCIAVCGQIVGAVPSCHTYLQDYQIRVSGETGIMADGTLTFTALSQRSADWMRVKIGESIVSDPMRVVEAE